MAYTDYIRSQKSTEDYLKSYLMEILQGGGLARRNIFGNINKSFDTATERMKEGFAARGTLGSGISTAGLAELEGQRVGALSEADVKLNEQAIMNLFQLAQLENQPDPIMQLLGQLIGAGGQIGAAYALKPTIPG